MSITFFVYKIMKKLRLYYIDLFFLYKVQKRAIFSKKLSIKLIEKISNKAEHKEELPPKFEDTIVAYHQPDSERVKLEESKLGAMTLAELNKIYFGL